MNENAWHILLSFCKSLWPFKLYMSMTYLRISWFVVRQKSLRWLDTLMRKCLQIRELYCFWANKIWHNLSCVIFLEYLRRNALRWLIMLKNQYEGSIFIKSSEDVFYEKHWTLILAWHKGYVITCIHHLVYSGCGFIWNVAIFY